jgi:hypothetical protein
MTKAETRSRTAASASWAWPASPRARMASSSRAPAASATVGPYTERSTRARSTSGVQRTRHSSCRRSSPAPAAYSGPASQVAYGTSRKRRAWRKRLASRWGARW